MQKYIFRIRNQGSPGISEITQGRFFFKAVQETPPPLLGQKQICQEYFKKNIYGSGICSKKNIYGFGIYYKNIVYLSMPCIVSLLSTPVKPYAALEASISDLRQEITEELTDHRGSCKIFVRVKYFVNFGRWWL